jgi:hypothetical protein
MSNSLSANMALAVSQQKLLEKKKKNKKKRAAKTRKKSEVFIDESLHVIYVIWEPK